MMEELASLLVCRLAPAPTAELLHLHTITVVVTVLLRDVVAALALTTLERHVHTSITSHFSPLGS